MLFFAVDEVHGTDARRLLQGNGPLAVSRALRLVCQVLEALAYAQSLGIVHCNVKPSKMLVSKKGDKENALISFEPAVSHLQYDAFMQQDLDQNEYEDSRSSNAIGRSVAYLSPEDITEDRVTKPPSDQYAAAASLYNLLTNRYVYDFPDLDYQKQLLLILNEDPVPITKRRKDIPKGLAAAIHRALSREPSDRFPDCQAFRAALLPFC